MPQASEKIDYGDEIMGWKVPEYEKHERTKSWYIIATTVALLLLLFSFVTLNFLFAVIIIVVALVVIIHDGREPDKIKVSITDEGVFVGKKFFDFDEFRNFAVVYKPHQEVKNLYFEFKSFIRPRLSIPLQNVNPLSIRKNLLKYISEDLDRTDQSLSEGLAKLFKL